jgi:mRNA interferase MazF
VDVVAAAPQRGEVYLVRLDPTIGHEIRKVRPCLVVSPDELNAHLGTLLVAPLTTSGRLRHTRIPCQFQRRHGFVVLDQLRTIDRQRLVKALGRIAATTLTTSLERLRAMFAE